jgi:hypothetical protein
MAPPQRCAPRPEQNGRPFLVQSVGVVASPQRMPLLPRPVMRASQLPHALEPLQRNNVTMSERSFELAQRRSE